MLKVTDGTIKKILNAFILSCGNAPVISVNFMFWRSRRRKAGPAYFVRKKGFFVRGSEVVDEHDEDANNIFSRFISGELIQVEIDLTTDCPLIYYFPPVPAGDLVDIDGIKCLKYRSRDLNMKCTEGTVAPVSVAPLESVYSNPLDKI